MLIFLLHLISKFKIKKTKLHILFLKIKREKIISKILKSICTQLWNLANQKLINELIEQNKKYSRIYFKCWLGMIFRKIFYFFHNWNHAILWNMYFKAMFYYLETQHIFTNKIWWRWWINSQESYNDITRI